MKSIMKRVKRLWRTYVLGEVRVGTWAQRHAFFQTLTPVNPHIRHSVDCFCLECLKVK